MQHADVGHRGAEARSTAIPRVASADDPQEVTMNTSSVRLVATTLAVLACAASCSLRASGPPTPAEVARQVDRLAVPFVANAGQRYPRVAYSASTFSGTVLVTKEGELVYALPAPGQHAPAGVREQASGWTLTERFVDGHPSPIGTQSAPTHVSV